MAKGRKTSAAGSRSVARGAKAGAVNRAGKNATKSARQAAPAGSNRTAKGSKETPQAVGRAAKSPTSGRSPVGRHTAAKNKNESARKRPAGSRTASAGTAPASRRPPTLDRNRRTVDEQDLVPTPPSSLDLDRGASAARTGRQEYEQRLREHTSTGPALTGGDIDADWEDAESVGDEAPGGDNPTPDQDVVEEIGQALGVTYQDNEELQGGEKIVERDRHRWELDPASREDYNEE